MEQNNISILKNVLNGNKSDEKGGLTASEREYRLCYCLAIACLADEKVDSGEYNKVKKFLAEHNLNTKVFDNAVDDLTDLSDSYEAAKREELNVELEKQFNIHYSELKKDLLDGDGDVLTDKFNKLRETIKQLNDAYAKNGKDDLHKELLETFNDHYKKLKKDLTDSNFDLLGHLEITIYDIMFIPDGQLEGLEKQILKITLPNV